MLLALAPVQQDIGRDENSFTMVLDRYRGYHCVYNFNLCFGVCKALFADKDTKSRIMALFIRHNYGIVHSYTSCPRISRFFAANPKKIVSYPTIIAS